MKYLNNIGIPFLFKLRHALQPAMTEVFLFKTCYMAIKGSLYTERIANKTPITSYWIFRQKHVCNLFKRWHWHYFLCMWRSHTFPFFSSIIYCKSELMQREDYLFSERKGPFEKIKSAFLLRRYFLSKCAIWITKKGKHFANDYDA